MLPADFISCLRCPVTGSPLRLVDAHTGAAGSAGGARAQAALATEDGSILYPIHDGILCLLPHAAAPTGNTGEHAPDHGTGTKDRVQAFYDAVGWEKRDDKFVDAVIYEDLRPVAARYIHDCHLRVARHLAPSGRYLLDAASGPVQYEEYLAYSAGYRARVCVDISFRALVEARKKLGDRGLYVLADVSNLPFRDDTFDAVVSLHTVYHVPKDEQERAFRELFRVLAPSRRGVIVYSWGIHALLTKVAVLPVWGWRMVARRIRRRLGAASDHAAEAMPRLYSYHHSYRWLATRVWPLVYELDCWRSVGVEFTRLYCHSWLFGKGLLRLLFRLEDRWPRLFGIIGQYPMIVLAKPPASAEA